MTIVLGMILFGAIAADTAASSAFSDDFSSRGADRWEASGSGDTWHTGNGVLRCVTDEQAEIILAATEPMPEAVVRVDFRLLGGRRRNVSLVFGATDLENYSAIRRYDVKNWLERLRFVNGEALRVGGNHWLAESGEGSATVPDGAWYTMEVGVVGDLLLARLWPRGEAEPEWMLHAKHGLEGPGRFGLIADQCLVEFDSFTITTDGRLAGIREEALRERRAQEERRRSVILAGDSRSDTFAARFRCEIARPAEATAGFLFRAADADNHYAALLRDDGLSLVKVLDGETLSLAATNEARTIEPGAYCVDVEVAVAEEDEEGPAWFIDGRGIPTLVTIRARAYPEGAPPPDWQLTVTDDPLIPGQKGEPYWHDDLYGTSSAEYPFGTRLGVLRSSGVRYFPPVVRRIRKPEPPSARWRPYTTIRTDERGGCWLALGDVDDDGDLDFVVARNEQQAVRSLTAFSIDGKVLWRWGEGGAADIGYDVPATVYDIDGDGANEVLCGIEGCVLILDGRTGREERRLPLPEGLEVADCIIAANFRGRPRPEDLLIKTRYTQVWAVTNDGEELWSWTGTTGHHPAIADVDGDGRDEVLCSFTLLDDDGSEMWSQPLPGHADSARITHAADAPLFLSTCCGGNDCALMDLDGQMLWRKQPAVMGNHYQSAYIAEMIREIPGPEIVVGCGCSRWRTGV